MKKVIIFPTDTVYGIGTGFLNKAGIERIYKLKGRDFNKPMAILCSSLDQISAYAEVTIEAEKLAKAFWPGSLTLILNSNENYFRLTGEKTIGVRKPNHKTALDLIKMYGPLKTTSVNKTNEAPLNDYETIKLNYEKSVDKIYPNDYQSSEVSSTVVDLTKKDMVILRAGSISIEDIKKVLQT